MMSSGLGNDVWNGCGKGFFDGNDLIEDQGDVVMTAKTVDIPPRPVDRKAPQYPRRARKEKSKDMLF